VSRRGLIPSKTEIVVYRRRRARAKAPARAARIALEGSGPTAILVDLMICAEAGAAAMTRRAMFRIAIFILYLVKINADKDYHGYELDSISF